LRGCVSKKRATIAWVVKHKLCTGCGTCAGICPHDALDMVIDAKRGCYVPRLDENRCTECGLCYDACPGHGVDFDGLSAALFGSDASEDIALGRYLGCYIGAATDKEVRYNSSSGGLVSSLLIFALERGLIDAALVTRMRRDNPLRPEPFLARTKEEVLSAAGSKYCPVAADMALKEVLAREDRVAVVGLPCHIQGVRKAEESIPKLKKQIRFRVSIACSLNFSFLGTERFLKGLGIGPADVEVLQYRGRGWPGCMLIRLKDGTERVVAPVEYYQQLGPYSLRRCTLCSDMLGELSDLSCGDAWIPEVMRTDKLGSSFVVSRTCAGEELLEAATSNEVIELSELGVEELLTSQGHALSKKRRLKARMSLFRWCGQRVPDYNQRLLTPTRADYINTVKFYVARYVMSGNHRILQELLHLIRRRKGKPPAPHVILSEAKDPASE
jgi:coenzyme F420 hydrogenase subunit beta